MFSSKKAGVTWPQVLAAVMVGVVLIIGVGLAFKSGILAKSVGKELSSCMNPILGEKGCCSCFYPEEKCPSGYSGTLSEGCPREACTDISDYATQLTTAKKAYDVELKSLKEDIGGDLGSDLETAIRAKHFGQCCRSSAVEECPPEQG